MRWSILVAMLLLVTAPLAALQAASGHRPPGRPASPTPRSHRLWFAVSAIDGLHISDDGGRSWRRAAGMPRGSFSSIAADSSRPGHIYAANGDIYETTDGGRSWSRLTPPAKDAGPAGYTALAVDPVTHALYAAGRQIVAYTLDTQEWTTVGRWPEQAAVQQLLADTHGNLFATAGGRLFRLTSSTAQWAQVAGTADAASRVARIAVGPDDASVFGALTNGSLLSIDASGVHQLEVGYPPQAHVYDMLSDQVGGDLYVATSAGLFARHQATSVDADQLSLWRQIATSQSALPTLLFLSNGDMVAVAPDGRVLRGIRQQWQELQWSAASQSLGVSALPVVGALDGDAVQPSTAHRQLPPEFASGCLPFGPAQGRSYFVCGPFEAFYLRFRHPVLGWPRSLAIAEADGTVHQVFENVVLQWRRGQQVMLAPLPAAITADKRFPKPSPNAYNNDTAYVNGYFVDPAFYQFWRDNSIDQVSIFGFPISQKMYDVSTDGSGRRVPVQYFQNARLELHTEGGIPQVRLSSFGQ